VKKFDLIFVIMVVLLSLVMFTSCSDDDGNGKTDETQDETTDEVTDEVADEAVDEKADEKIDEVADEKADEVADEVPDEIVDETIDEAIDETPDETTDEILIDSEEEIPTAKEGDSCVEEAGDDKGFFACDGDKMLFCSIMSGHEFKLYEDCEAEGKTCFVESDGQIGICE